MDKESLHNSEDITNQFVKLLEQLDKLKKRNKELAKENKSLREECDESKKEIAEYKNKYERIKLAKAFGLSEESKKQAHRRIDKLVRDINSCISILKK